MTVIESPVMQNRFYIDTINDKSYMMSEYGNDIFLPKLGFKIDDTISNLKIILDTFSNEQQSLIYCNTVEKTISAAIELSEKYEEVYDVKIKDTIRLIDEKVHKQYYLKKCLKKGIAYHFGAIPEEIKVKIEELYKDRRIKFLFCTSTLLEGVNLPAKNIFILSEKIGHQKMSDIDFWNLSGRAGRLSKDLSGNIFCVNLYDEKGYWKEEKNIKILKEKIINPIEPQIISKANCNLYKNIANYFESKAYTNKSMSEDQKKSIEMYGNILLYHNLINSDSILKNNFLNNNDNYLSILNKIRNNLKVPAKILATSIDINFENQNKIISNKTPMLPEATSYDNCLEVLNILYEQYNWSITESKGRHPMVKNKAQLNYYAILMEAWINSEPLKVLIQKTIRYYHNRERGIIQNGDFKMVKFNKDDDYLVNNLINDIVRDIENILMFKIKNYVSNYQALLKAKKYSINADWEKYIEYGTTDLKTIEIQNLGFTRNIAIFLKKYYKFVFLEDEKNHIYGFNEELLKEKIDKIKYRDEYEDISKFLDWNNE